MGRATQTKGCNVRIFGVDVSYELPSVLPTPGRAQAWDVARSDDGMTQVHIRFADEAGDLSEHVFDCAVNPLLGSHLSSTIVILASHPNDVRSAIASYRVLGWAPIAQAPPADFDRYGYALCLLSSPSRG
jgi:hypothetical protein